MANPTSAFGWQMPTSTDLVTDLPADFEVFGQAVDTSLADLKGGSTGQVLSKNSNTDMDFVWVTSDDANAIQNTIVDAKGDLIAASAADTPARLAVGNNGETLVADSSTATGLRWQGDYAAGKNKIINGDFGINQRSFVSTTSNATFGFDRFQLRTNDALCTYSAQVFTPGAAPVAGYESTNYARLVTSGQTASNTLSILRTLIEDVRTYAGQTVTVSFWVKANSGTPKVNVSVTQLFGTGGSSGVETVSTPQTITTSWARYSFTIALPSISGKTIGTGQVALSVSLFVSTGTDFPAIAVGIQSNTFDFWGVQLEQGLVATAFQTATGTIQGELAACQRYYYRATGVSGGTSPLCVGISTTTTTALVTLQNPVQMRTTPSGVLDYSSVAVTNATSYTNTASNLTLESANSNVVRLTATATGQTTNQPVNLLLNANGYVGLSAEL